MCRKNTDRQYLRNIISTIQEVETLISKCDRSPIPGKIRQVHVEKAHERIIMTVEFTPGQIQHSPLRVLPFLHVIEAEGVTV